MSLRDATKFPMKKNMSDVAFPTKNEEEQIPAQKTRKCLFCSQDFPSEWAGERVCKKCKATAAWRQG